MAKNRFVIVGSGYRSLYYVRIAKAFPGFFEVAAMYCRSKEKAEKMSKENDIYTTTSIEECIKLKPDFVVVAVDKSSISKVVAEWMDYGFTVLSETPIVMEYDNLKMIYGKCSEGKKLVVAEQYTRFSENASRLKVVQSGILGELSCLNISLAHEYHGISLIRTYLGINPEEKYKITARTYEFDTARTFTRYESFKDGSVEKKKRTIAIFEFESGKVAIYDFDSEQYRSPIRINTIKLQGVRGEIVDDTVYYLDENNEAREEKIDPVETIFENGILSEDEKAVASLMLATGDYSRDEADCPYTIDEALADAYGMMLMREAVSTGRIVESEGKVWCE